MSLPARLSRLSFAALVALAVPAQAQTVQTNCKQAVLMDAESHAFLYERGADDLASPASLAKIMTAEILFGLIKAGKVSLEDTYVISEYAWRTGGAPSRGSTMFAQLNSRVRVEDLIRGLVIMSGNDAAIAIAEGIAGTEEAFGQMMTKRARELGLTRSSFTNPWGRSDPGQKVTMREMALLSDHLIKTYPDLYRYFAEKDFTWNKITQANRNPLLLANIGADGLKTGNIDESGYAIAGSAVENNQRLIVALNGCKTASERSDDARKLLLWGFRSFEPRTLFGAGDVVGSASVYGGTRSDAPLVSKTPIKVFLPRGSGDKLSAKIVYDGPLVPPVKQGAVVARLKVMRGQNLALDAPLVSAEEIGVGSLPRRAFDASLELAGGLIRKHVFKK